MARSGPKPLDVIMADLGFLNEYLTELAENFRNEGNQEAAEIADGWATLPLEVIEKFDELSNR